MSVESSEEQRPPVFKHWKGWYWLVILVLVIQVIVYSLITNSF